MNNLDMYKIAENENIDILNYNWSNSKAKIFEIDNSYYIALDNKQIDNSIEEKESKDIIEKIEKLKNLLDTGALTKEEFENQKKKLLL